MQSVKWKPDQRFMIKVAVYLLAAFLIYVLSYPLAFVYQWALAELLNTTFSLGKIYLVQGFMYIALGWVVSLEKVKANVRSN